MQVIEIIIIIIIIIIVIIRVIIIIIIAVVVFVVVVKCMNLLIFPIQGITCLLGLLKIFLDVPIANLDDASL